MHSTYQIKFDFSKKEIHDSINLALLRLQKFKIKNFDTINGGFSIIIINSVFEPQSYLDISFVNDETEKTVVKIIGTTNNNENIKLQLLTKKNITLLVNEVCDILKNNYNNGLDFEPEINTSGISLQENNFSAPLKQNTISNKKGCGVLIIGCIAFFLAIKSSCSGDNKSSEPLTKEQEDSVYQNRASGMAEVMAHQFVKELLKAPSTADFPSYETKIWYLKDSTFMVKGVVDSQNSFGAMIRSNYEAKVKQVDKENWIVIERNIY